METIDHGAHQHYEIEETPDGLQVALVWNVSGRAAKTWRYRLIGLEFKVVGRAPWIPPMGALDQKLIRMKVEFLGNLAVAA